MRDVLSVERNYPRDGRVMMKLFVAMMLCMAFCASYSYGQGLNLKISAPTTVTVNWPANEDILDLSQWFNYLIFVGIVLVAIILIGILLEFLDCSIWCSRRVCNCCGGHKLKNYDPYSGPGYSKKRVCCVGTILVLIFLTVLGAGGVYVAFNALFSINIRKLIETGNDVLKGVNGTLNAAIKSTSEGLPNAISTAVSDIKDVTINPAKVICASIGGINTILDGVTQKVGEIENEIPYLSVTIPNEIIDIINDLNSKITYNPNSKAFVVSGVNIDTSSLQTKIQSAYDNIITAEDQVLDAARACNKSVSDVEDSLTSPNNNFFSTAVVTAQNSIFQTINSFSSMLNQLGLDQVSVYVSYVNIADSVRLALELVIVAAPMLFFCVVTIGICANKKFLFKAPACCLFITFWLLFIVSSLHIAFWIITKDICKEVPKRQDFVLSLVGNMTGGNPLAQFNTTISDAAKGILTCKTDFITEALGGSEKSATTLRSIIGIDGSLTSSISSMTSKISISNSISVGSDVSSSFSSLNIDYNSLTSTLRSDLSKFQTSMISLRTSADVALNGTIAGLNNPSITRENIQIYCTTHAGSNVCVKYQEYLNATRQVDDVNAGLAQVDVKLGLLKSKIDDINLIINTYIKTAPQQISDKADSIFNSVTKLVADINSSASTMIEKVITNVIAVFTDPLSCTFIPRAINNVDAQFCSGIVLDSIIIGVSSFAVGILCAVGFIFILLIDKYRTYQLKVQNKGKDKTPKSEKKGTNPMDLLRQIELTEDRDNARAKGAAPALEDLSPPTYEEANGNFFY